MPYGHIHSAWFIVAIQEDIVCRVNKSMVLEVAVTDRDTLRGL